MNSIRGDDRVHATSAEQELEIRPGLSPEGHRRRDHAAHGLLTVGTLEHPTEGFEQPERVLDIPDDGDEQTALRAELVIDRLDRDTGVARDRGHRQRGLRGRDELAGSSKNPSSALGPRLRAAPLDIGPG